MIFTYNFSYAPTTCLRLQTGRYQNKNICEFSSDYLFEYLQKNDVNLLLETAEQTLNVEYDVLTNYFQTYIRKLIWKC